MSKLNAIISSLANARNSSQPAPRAAEPPTRSSSSGRITKASDDAVVFAFSTKFKAAATAPAPASNETSYIQTEFVDLKSEVERISSVTEFSGLSLDDGSQSPAPTGGGRDSAAPLPSGSADSASRASGSNPRTRDS